MQNKTKAQLKAVTRTFPLLATIGERIKAKPAHFSVWEKNFIAQVENYPAYFPLSEGENEKIEEIAEKARRV